MTFKTPGPEGKEAAVGTLLLCAAAALFAPGMVLAQGQAKPKEPAKSAAKAGEEKPQVYAFGETEISAPEIQFDFGSRKHVFLDGVTLTQKQTKMTAKTMTVQVTPKNEVEWARCEGDVFIEKKGEDGVNMDARAATVFYRVMEQKAELDGGVVLHQTSPKLAKPAQVTGSRVDLDLSTKQNIVHRSKDAQAKVHLDPIGKEGQPAPEAIDLIGDRIEMNGATQEYVATGNPLVKRPSAVMTAKRIRFQVDDESKDVKVAYAEEDVVYDGKNDKGATIYVTGDHGVFNKEKNELVIRGNVKMRTQRPDDAGPTTLNGETFVYNTKTGQGSMKRGQASPAIFTLPDKVNPGDKKDAPDAKKAPEKKQ